MIIYIYIEALTKCTSCCWFLWRQKSQFNFNSNQPNRQPRLVLDKSRTLSQNCKAASFSCCKRSFDCQESQKKLYQISRDEAAKRIKCARNGIVTLLSLFAAQESLVPEQSGIRVHLNCWIQFITPHLTPLKRKSSVSFRSSRLQVSSLPCWVQWVLFLHLPPKNT